MRQPSVSLLQLPGMFSQSYHTRLLLICCLANRQHEISYDIPCHGPLWKRPFPTTWHFSHSSTNTLRSLRDEIVSIFFCFYKLNILISPFSSTSLTLLGSFPSKISTASQVRHKLCSFTSRSTAGHKRG